MSAKNYKKWNRVFRVVKHPKTGRFFCGGKKRGYQDYVLDRVGTFGTEDEAQAALDRWAAHVGAVPVAPAGFVLARQGRLF